MTAAFYITQLAVTVMTCIAVTALVFVTTRRMTRQWEEFMQTRAQLFAAAVAALSAAAASAATSGVNLEKAATDLKSASAEAQDNSTAMDAGIAQIGQVTDLLTSFSKSADQLTASITGTPPAA